MICLLGLIILVNTTLVHCVSGSIGCYSCCLGYWGFMDLRLLLVWCLQPLAVSMDGGKFLVISSIDKIVHITD